jgi:nitroreductase
MNPTATDRFLQILNDGIHLITAFLILKARAMGFDTLIMGGRDADALRATFSIPENETVMAVIALGYRKDEPQRPPRRPFDEVVKFY